MKKLTALLGGLLVASMMVPAQASHPTRLCLDVGADHPWHDRNGHTANYMEVRLGVSDSNHPPDSTCHTDQSGPLGEETNVDLELTGNADPDNSDTPESPDMTCTIPPNEQHCRVNPPDGADTFRVWVDEDGDGSTVEADRTEGPDESDTPGDEAEPDLTDVAEWEWGTADTCEDFGSCDGSANTYRQPTTVTIVYDERDNLFSGDVYNPRRNCGRGRLIVLMKARSGKDQWSARTASVHGQWSLRKTSTVEGRFYARAAQKRFTASNGDTIVCKEDRSRMIRVR